MTDEPKDATPAARPSAADIRKALKAVAGLPEVSGTADLDDAAEIIGAAARDDPARLQATLEAMAGERIGGPAIGLFNESWLSCAVVGPAGIVYADPVLRDGLTQTAAGRKLMESIEALARRSSRARRAFARLPITGRKSAMAVAARGEAAGAWPIPLQARAPSAAKDAIVVLAFTPEAGEGFAALIGPVYGLTPAEARLAALLFHEPSVESAAQALGLSLETVRQRVRILLRKTGSFRRADLTAKITELLAGDYIRDSARAALLREALGLSAAEARVADAVASGLTVPEIARRNRVSVHTVRAQLDAALDKAGAGRAAQLARIACEVCALASWTSCGEARRIDQRRLIAATRMIVAPGRRQIAAADYGPPSGAPVLYVHPGYCHRWVRRALAQALADHGFRSLSLDLPDCGLTDAAPDLPMFEAAAVDIETTLTALKIPLVRLFAEFGGAAPALAFAARRPDMVVEGVLLLPRAPSQEPAYPGPIQRAWRGLVAKPELALAFYEAMRTGAGSRYWKWIQNQLSQAVEADRRAMADPVFLEERIGEMNTCCVRSVRGLIALDQAHMAGWIRPSSVGGGRWTIVDTAVKPFGGAETSQELWGWLPNARFVTLADAGRLATHSHAEAIAQLFARS